MMEELNGNEFIKACFEKAVYLAKLKKNDSYLLEELNKLPNAAIASIQKKYANEEGPINSLRLKVANAISKKQVVTEELLKTFKDETLSDKNVFRAFRTQFSLFFPFFLENNPVDEKVLLRTVSTEIINNLGLKDVKVNIVGFNGSMNYGNDWIWFAIYNATHPNQKTAKQLFFSLGDTGIFISQYDRPRDVHIKYDQLEINQFNTGNVTEFFSSYKQAIIDDIFSEGTDAEDTVIFPDIYKLSHGENVITNEQHAALIAANLVVVNEETAGMGTSWMTQYGAFEGARIGDLFYLCRSNQSIVLIGKFTSYCEPCSINGIGQAWQQRRFELVANALQNKGYRGTEKTWWLPNFNSTFYRIPKDSYEKADNELFIKYFDKKINTLINENRILRTKRSGSNKKASGAENHTRHAEQKSKIATQIFINDTDTEPILGLAHSISPFTQIIKSLKSEPGQMLGIFGSWGRGKTYFVRHLCKNLNIDFQEGSDNDSEFYFVKFHAWKYQDTKAAWAYLYSELATKYYTHSNYTAKNFFFRILNKGIEYRKLFKLNLTRNGFTQLYLLSLSFVIITLLLLGIIPLSWFKSTDWKTYLGTLLVGFPFANTFYKMYRIGNFSRQIVKRYTERPTFSQLLGVQAEIQTELIALLTTWIKTKPVAKKRILLFVDDLDRCDADQMIRVIDALRVMLEDSQISSRLIVLTAIDEQILKGAITYKYDQIRGTLANNDVHLDMKATVREYIDKLFISGIRLHPLANEDKIQVLENFAKKHKLIVLEDQKPNKARIVDQPIKERAFDRNIYERIDEEYRAIEDAEINEQQQIILEETDEITSNELSWINEGLVNQEKCTPRQIRIILYRYFLAKAISQQYNNFNKLSDEYCRYMAIEITHKTFSKTATSNLDDILDDDLKEFAPKIIQMVVPY
ncbi:MAG: P-loop NTPase fold protein [Fluviicola sp.]|nr:P-loop NTPase fold protein [Fluviicola sp.]